MAGRSGQSRLCTIEPVALSSSLASAASNSPSRGFSYDGGLYQHQANCRTPHILSELGQAHTLRLRHLIALRSPFSPTLQLHSEVFFFRCLVMGTEHGRVRRPFFAFGLSAAGWSFEARLPER